MEVQTLTYSKTAGWNVYPLPELDSVDTLVMIFGSARFHDYPWALDDLRSSYPSARLMTFATPSDELGMSAEEDTLQVAVMRLKAAPQAAPATQITAPVGKGAELELKTELEFA